MDEIKENPAVDEIKQHPDVSELDRPVYIIYNRIRFHIRPFDFII